MSVILVRIDDRLVHGQVVEGWLRALRINHVVVASDIVTADETQIALYSLAVPQGTRLSCLSVQEAINAWKQDAWSKDKVLILLSNPQDALRMVEADAPMRSLNVGGLHYKEGRVQLLKAVSLDEPDVAAFRGLLEKGVALEARPLPLDEAVDLAPLIERWSVEPHSVGDQPR